MRKGDIWREIRREGEGGGGREGRKELMPHCARLKKLVDSGIRALVLILLCDNKDQQVNVSSSSHIFHHHLGGVFVERPK